LFHISNVSETKSPLGEQLGLAASSINLEDIDAYHRSVLRTVPDAMVVSDDQGIILSFSATAEVMFGYSEAEVVGQNVNMLMPQADGLAHDGFMKHYLDTGEARVIGSNRATMAKRHDGIDFPIEITLGEAQTARGRIFTGFIRDITERQRTERRLQDVQSELSHISRISAMDSLAAALAHELNQPLTAIANYMAGARDMVDKPDTESRQLVREAMSEAATQALRAGQIVRRLRDFISRGTNEKNVESLRHLVAEACALAQVSTDKVDVAVMLDDSVDLVLVDRIQIQQVLVNLLRIAIEAMQSSPRSRIEIRSHASPHGMVGVTVADSGPGIAPEISEHLFEPFRSDKFQGMGLGLSICRTIVESHGGHIWTDRSESGGAAFHFTLMSSSFVNA
jgi:two-component system sensor kinase FixL